MIGTQILLTYYVQNVRELSALQTGVILLPGALLMGFMSPVTGKIFDKFGGCGLALYGFTAITFALAVYMLLSVTTPIWINALFFVFISLGIRVAFVIATI